MWPSSPSAGQPGAAVSLFRRRGAIRINARGDPGSRIPAPVGWSSTASSRKRQAPRRRPAARLRRVGQEGQHLVRRLGPRVGPGKPLPVSMRRHLPNARLENTGRPLRSRRARGQAAAIEQGTDRPGVARPGPRRGATGPGRDYRLGLWRLGAEPRRPGRAGLRDVVGVTDEMVVFTGQPWWAEPRAATDDRPRTRQRLADDPPRLVSLKGMDERMPRDESTWREGTRECPSCFVTWKIDGHAGGSTDRISSAWPGAVRPEAMVGQVGRGEARGPVEPQINVGGRCIRTRRAEGGPWPPGPSTRPCEWHR